MPVRTKEQYRIPRKFHVQGCSLQCTLNDRNLPGRMADVLHEWFEAGWNNEDIIVGAAKAGVKLSNGSVGRHRAGHLVKQEELTSVDPRAEDALPPVSDLGVLDQIIAKGSRSLQSTQIKISAEQVIRAIELKFRLTQGSAMDELMSALTDAMTEDPVAASSDEEKEQGDSNEEGLLLSEGP